MAQGLRPAPDTPTPPDPWAGAAHRRPRGGHTEAIFGASLPSPERKRLSHSGLVSG